MVKVIPALQVVTTMNTWKKQVPYDLFAIRIIYLLLQPVKAATQFIDKDIFAPNARLWMICYLTLAIMLPKLAGMIYVEKWKIKLLEFLLWAVPAMFYISGFNITYLKYLFAKNLLKGLFITYSFLIKRVYLGNNVFTLRASRSALVKVEYCMNL